MKKIILTAIFLTSTVVFASGKPSIRDISKGLESCKSKKVAVVEMRSCVARAQMKADELVRDTVADITENKDMPQSLRERLERSQKSWFVFRANQCTYEASDILDGTGDGLVFDECVLKMTLDRIYSLTTN